ncbi:MAG: hypothetical protein Q9207_005543 [Kuettlingeria erythrocarpa]
MTTANHSATGTTSETGNASREMSMIHPIQAQNTTEQLADTPAEEKTATLLRSTGLAGNIGFQAAEQEQQNPSDTEKEASLPNAKSSATRKQTATGDQATRPNKSARNDDSFLLATAAEAREVFGLVAPETYGHHNPREQSIQIAKEAFMGKESQSDRDWKSLDQYAYTTKDKSYEPYDELDDMMGRVWEIGRVSVQLQFRGSVHAWNHDHSQRTNDVEIPQHLVRLQGLPGIVRELPDL